MSGKTSKKILHLIESLGNGGCENWLLRTIPALPDFEHLVVTLGAEGALAPKFHEKNIRILNLGGRGLWDLRIYRELLNTLKTKKPDIVITYLFRADMVGRLFLQFFTSRKVIPYLRTTYNYPRYFVVRLFEIATRGLAYAYLANSDSVKNFYVEKLHVNKDKITVIPNGIEIKENKRNRGQIRQALGLDRDDIAIVCVANFSPNKGHSYLIDAFQEIQKKHQRIRLLLVGDGRERENLISQAKNNKRIVFLGQRSDIYDILTASDIFAFPSLFEGMSNSVMEAMTSGLPCVVSDINENQELISNNTHGLTFKSGDSRDLAKKLIYLIENPAIARNLGANAKQKIAKEYAMPEITRRLTAYLSNNIETNQK